MNVRAVFEAARDCLRRGDGPGLRAILAGLPPLVAVQIACMVIHAEIPSGPALHFSALLDDQDEDDE